MADAVLGISKVATQFTFMIASEIHQSSFADEDTELSTVKKCV